MKILVLLVTRSHQRTILTLRQEEAETKTRGSSCWTLKAQMDLWINAMASRKQRKLVTGCTENMQQQQDLLHARIHPQCSVRQRPEQQFEGHEEDCYRIDSETGWKYFLLATTSSCSSSGGQHGIGTFHHGMSKRFLSSRCEHFRLQAIAILV